jgi:adenine-specific DNA-methyltransferase
LDAQIADAGLQRDAQGDDYCREHAPDERRASGITLTPLWLVERMLQAAGAPAYDTIVDCGAGSGRFAVAAALMCPRAKVLAVESHPHMLQLLRDRVQAAGLGRQITVVAGDFRTVALDLQGRTLWLGNPPYVRHHDIDPVCKEAYQQGMAARGIKASQLAGLHAHFLLRAVQALRPGDGLCFVMAAEWLDNRYGQALRELCTGAGVRVQGLWLADADEAVFDDALVSAAVLHLQAGLDGARGTAAAADDAQVGSITGRRLHTLRAVRQAVLADAPRWSEFARIKMPQLGSGPALGDLFQITRGQVTGANSVWVLPPGQTLLPERLTTPAVTRAREIIDDAIGTPESVLRLKRVASLPRDLAVLTPAERQAADLFIRLAQNVGADLGYVARQRKPWHWLDLRAPPAALVSYMGRRPPVFRANPQALSYLNIAHGLYPRQPLPAGLLPRLLAHLNQSVDINSGRVYGGGLVKFEPSDVARLRLPAQWLEGSD